ncbi:hypothetical protein AB4Z21_05890 [Paenibacillus sp. MCAF20]
MSRQDASLAAFVGTTPNIGTTAASFATAYRMAGASSDSIAYFCLNLKSAKLHRFLGEDEPEVSLDKLRPELIAQTLTPDKLRRAASPITKLPNLHVLFGNMVRDQAEFFSPEEVNHLLDVARETFAYVILDVSAYWDNAATVCALRMADVRILVTTPALSHFQEDGKRWINQVSPLFGVTPDQYETVIIHNSHGSGGYRMKEICKELGTTSLGQFKLGESLFSQLDSGRYEEWLRSDAQGKQAMDEPAKQLMHRHGIHPVFKPGRTQPWHRKLMTHRRGSSS